MLPVVPMFHVNAWGLPYSVPHGRAPSWCFPGRALDGKSLYELFEAEKVTFSAGVPTVWLGLLNYVEQNDLHFSTLQRTVIGGSACPPAMMRRVPGRVRRRGAARLGHDRDVAARHRRARCKPSTWRMPAGRAA